MAFDRLLKNLAWGFLALGLGCQRPPPINASTVAGECTGQTPLVPGVPGSPGHLIASDINPNGQSELAFLMRQMVADLENARNSFRNRTPLGAHHRKIRCAWPTSLADRNPTFDALAVQYLAAVEAFDAEKRTPEAAYERVVNACVACHQQSCEGPIEKIEKLRLSRSPQ